MNTAPAFERDAEKNLQNVVKHGVSFGEAQHAFLDSDAVIAEDQEHSQEEPSFYCIGRDPSGEGILTVRFAYRAGAIRIMGAGYWRKGKKIYEEKNSLYG